MAYRFLLSVPTPLVDDANIAVAQAGDAQVLVVRNSHGLGFEDDYADLTVAAHSLRVVATIYDWYESMGPDRPPVGLALHAGDRLYLADHDRGSMVAAVRRDQPWVERTVPHIGQHARDEARTPVAVATTGASPAEGITASTVAASPVSPSDVAVGAMAGLAGASRPIPGAAAAAVTAPLGTSRDTPPAQVEAARAVAIRDLDPVAVRVPALPRAEAFYADVFGMEVVAREGDTAYLRNGPLVLAVTAVGRGARIDRDAFERVAIRVEPATFHQLRGEALMRPMEILAATDRSLTLRDPFGLVWEIGAGALPGSSGSPPGLPAGLGRGAAMIDSAPSTSGDGG